MRYEQTTIIEAQGKEVCRKGDKIRVVDNEGTEVVGIFDSIDKEDGDDVILFEGWNVRVILKFVYAIDKLTDELQKN